MRPPEEEKTAVLDWPEIVLRLGVATLAGGVIGLDRDCTASRSA